MGMASSCINMEKLVTMESAICLVVTYFVMGLVLALTALLFIQMEQLTVQKSAEMASLLALKFVTMGI